MNLHLEGPVHDSKTRRKLEDQRRMAFRRAIEDYAEQRRLQQELGGYPDLIPSDFLLIARGPQRHAA
ncbi:MULTISPECIES: transcriptional regulator [unclassified Pseudomonas]|uniref:PA3496 family putative envelope integrity protein n=1 Tax=unclassified Pseudomonas TaxID=196821 RepID=UPI00244A7040|nr:MULTISPECIES: transcriptional regulator [unclassified Pseudomonas]MDH0897685.1 transcriptional regulator [Pseudomonas sp. GD03875]MDH1064988.1 transcriptional regulator [Pseudomonas sp. GD03985]